MEAAKVLTLLGSPEEIWRTLLFSKEPQEIEVLFKSLIEDKILQLDIKFLDYQSIPPSSWHNTDYVRISRLLRKSETPEIVKNYVFIKIYFLKKKLIKDLQRKNTEAKIKALDSLLFYFFRHLKFTPKRLSVFWHYGVIKKDERLTMMSSSLLWNEAINEQDRIDLENEVRSSKDTAPIFKLILLSLTKNQAWFEEEFNIQIKPIKELKSGIDVISESFFPIFKAILNNHSLATNTMLDEVYEKIIKFEMRGYSKRKPYLLQLFKHPNATPELLKKVGIEYFKKY